MSENQYELSFMEDCSGVHVMQPGEDCTLCGTYDSSHNDLREIKKSIVTCPICTRMLKALRNVKYKDGAA